eukprot:TRINITY_DN1492_c0_g2_i1.p1 TRINITY_DN1492_c0_g2~~TRINITY_DN1492_c0_g2_i1.p1  ORF type:complete len:426 (+),score=69.50 TRINITY_DN1492_c0_g2_i1:356-1633(+)
MVTHSYGSYGHTEPQGTGLYDLETGRILESYRTLNDSVALVDDLLFSPAAPRAATISVTPWEGKISEEPATRWHDVIVVDYASKIGISKQRNQLRLIDFASKETKDIHVPLLSSYLLRDRRTVLGLWHNMFLCYEEHTKQCTVVDIKTSSILWSAEIPSSYQFCYCMGEDRILTSVRRDMDTIVELHQISTKKIWTLDSMKARGWTDVQLAMDSCKAIVLKRNDGHSNIMIFDVRDGTLMYQLYLGSERMMLARSDITDRIILSNVHAIVKIDFSDRWHNHATSINCIAVDGLPTMMTWPAPSLFSRIQTFFRGAFLICSCIVEIIQGDEKIRIYSYCKDTNTLNDQQIPDHLRSPARLTDRSFPGASLPVIELTEGQKLSQQSVYVKQVIRNHRCYFVNMTMADWNSIKLRQTPVTNAKPFRNR